MIDTLLVFAIAAWGGLGWRLRGGAFASLTGIDLGDLPTRAVFGGLWPSLPLALTGNWWAAGVPLALFVALCITSWGGFMALGHNPAEGPRASVTPLLGWLGLRIGTVPYDAAGLALNGLLVTLLPAALAAAVDWQHGAGLLVAGVVAMPCAYALAYRLPPAPPFVDDQTVWGEVFFGAALGAGLFLAFGGK